MVVAPTLPTSGKQKARPPPFPTPPLRRKRSLKDILARARPSPFPDNTTEKATASSETTRARGPGLPDLQRIQAFTANSSQAVALAPGVWQAPIITLGQKAVDFVVFYAANGVAQEDCQVVEISAERMAKGVLVVIDISMMAKKEYQQWLQAKL